MFKKALLLSILTLCSSKVLASTGEIGSVTAPTIDGGVINTSSNHKQLYLENPASTSTSDVWVNNFNIKKLLVAASQQNKLAYVLQQIELQELPTSVALIPMIESRYQTSAISNKGAAGAWQLMPALAKDYGMQPNDRFDFAASTDVALNYLKVLHQRFHSWELAFAAYHAGPGRITSAIRVNPHFQKIDELNIPIETKQYVHRLITLNTAFESLDVSKI
jgi:hypothetical protein